uniref:Uncharacterized protein n=1 Tax=Octactis speculum TaxID=3111310 RepID=A0A7S2DNQ9_9STRA
MEMRGGESSMASFLALLFMAGPHEKYHKGPHPIGRPVLHLFQRSRPSRSCRHHHHHPAHPAHQVLIPTSVPGVDSTFLEPLSLHIQSQQTNGRPKIPFAAAASAASAVNLKKKV